MERWFFVRDAFSAEVWAGVDGERWRGREGETGMNKTTEMYDYGSPESLFQWLRDLEKLVIRGGPTQLMPLAKMLIDATKGLGEGDARVNLLCGMAAGVKLAYRTFEVANLNRKQETEVEETKNVH